jgi:translin
MSLKDISNEIYQKFASQNQIRESVLGETRKILKSTREAIFAVHRTELEKAKDCIESAKSVLAAIQPNFLKLSALPVINLIQTAEGELAEALLLLSFKEGTSLPGPKQIGISEMGFLLGLGDFIGELRRVSIDALADDNLDLAKRAFSLMEEAYASLLIFDFPRGLMPGVRKKTDVARGLIERTRADISSEIQRRRLLTGMKDFQNSLKSS